MFRIFKKVWMPLLLVVVIALGAYAVVRIRDLFGVNPVAVAGDENGDRTAAFNPKHITYEITGHPAATPTSIILIRTGSLTASTRPHYRGRSPL